MIACENFILFKISELLKISGVYTRGSPLGVAVNRRPDRDELPKLSSWKIGYGNGSSDIADCSFPFSVFPSRELQTG